MSTQSQNVQEKRKVSIHSEDGDQISKTSDDSASIAELGLDASVLHTWFMALIKNDVEQVKTMAETEPRLIGARDCLSGNHNQGFRISLFN